MQLFRINWLAGKYSQLLKFKQVIAIHIIPKVVIAPILANSSLIRKLTLSFQRVVAAPQPRRGPEETHILSLTIALVRDRQQGLQGRRTRRLVIRVWRGRSRTRLRGPI